MTDIEKIRAICQTFIDEAKHQVDEVGVAGATEALARAFACNRVLDEIRDAPSASPLTDAEQIDLRQARNYIAAASGWTAFSDVDEAAKLFPVVARWLALLDRLTRDGKVLA